MLRLWRSASDMAQAGYSFIGTSIIFLFSLILLSSEDPIARQSSGWLMVIACTALPFWAVSGVSWLLCWLVKTGQPLRGTDFELARQRLARRQRTKVEIGVWVLLLGTGFLPRLVAIPREGWPLYLILPLISLFALFMLLLRLLQLYYRSPKRRFARATIEDEMRWLFGDDWAITTGPSEYLYAQDRLRRQRLERWSLVPHMLIVVPFFLYSLAGYVYYTVLSSQFSGSYSLGLAFSILWMSFVALHWARVFPSRKELEHRERRLGEALRLEQQRMYPDAANEKQKRKRYAFGDDGELVEVGEAEGDINQDASDSAVRM